MRRLLLQLDTSKHPSVFDRVVAYDGGADAVMSYGEVTEETVRDLVHGAIFTRGPKDLHNTGIFVGGTEMVLGERLLAAVQKAFLGPMRVSVMLDSSGSNTTAVAAVVKLQQAAGDIRGSRIVITAGTGPVGARAAGLLARAGADVVVTSRKPVAEEFLGSLRERFGGRIESATLTGPSGARALLESADLLLNTGPAGVRLVPRDAWVGRRLRVVADLNAVPPAGVEGVEPQDDGASGDGVTAFGALGIGKLKMKLHKACIARLFERNDHVLDVEAIAELAQTL
jgi:methylenetetrahydrofolate/methylenetetrahydromethanopterin dehydrogenase (NADP+)